MFNYRFVAMCIKAIVFYTHPVPASLYHNINQISSCKLQLFFLDII